MEATIRKLENSLVTIGTGVAILGLWELFKIILYVIVYWGEIKALSATLPPIEAALAIGLIVAVVVTELALNCFIGLSAVGEGQGIRKRSVYLIATGFLIVVNVAMILLEVSSLFFAEDFSLISAVSMVIDITLVGLLTDMLVSSLRLRKLKQQKAEKEGLPA